MIAIVSDALAFSAASDHAVTACADKIACAVSIIGPRSIPYTARVTGIATAQAQMPNAACPNFRASPTVPAATVANPKKINPINTAQRRHKRHQPPPRPGQQGRVGKHVASSIGRDLLQLVQAGVAEERAQQRAENVDAEWVR